MSGLASAVLHIDLDAFKRNIILLQQKARGAELAGVVKANAYGIGMVKAARVHLDCGTKTFFVATPGEGAALREAIGPGLEIAILGGLYHGDEAAYVHYDLIPVLNSLEETERWTGGRPAFLHIDTGMRRLGLETRDVEKLMADPSMLRGINITTVMSHFACADEPGHPLTQEQYDRFNAVLGLFPGARRSLSNSAGIFVAQDYHFDMVRPGMATYGLNPTTESNPMNPVVGLKTRVLQIRTALKGESVGYGASWTAPRECRIATVALGYADGFLRSLSNKGSLFWKGQALPIVGRVSMDLVTLDASSAAGLAPGDWVDVLGEGQDADALAAKAGTIGYEIMTDLGMRYARIYSPAKTFESKAISG